MEKQENRSVSMPGPPVKYLNVPDLLSPVLDGRHGYTSMGLRLSGGK